MVEKTSRRSDTHLANLNRTGRAFVAAALVLASASVGCKNSSSTSTSTESSILITNFCGTTVVVYCDGTQRSTIDTGSQATISSVAAGSRHLVVQTSDTGFVVLDETLTVVASATISVTVRGGASVRVTNLYGEILSIYEDTTLGTTLIGDIGNQVTLTMSQIGFGSHTYQAQKKSDGTVVAQFSIDVSDFSQFTWTITP